MLYNKNCYRCQVPFVGTGPAAKYCERCSSVRREEIKEQRRFLVAKSRAASGQIKMPGVGKGGFPHRGKAHPLYKHGKYTFETIRYDIKEERRYCERCHLDLQNIGRYKWNVHHKDHNHWNHDISNLELLCKRCHQIEHECWKAFTKAQRSSPKGSRG